MCANSWITIWRTSAAAGCHCQGGLRGHEYLARRVTESELVQRSPFMMLAEEVPEAREHMGRYGLAMVRQSDNSFVLLATQRNLLTLNRASAEEIQDHQCEILR